MRRLTAAFALTALAAAGIAMAQTAPTDPQSSAPSQQSQAPSDSTSSQSAAPSASTQSSSADKQALMKDCLTQVQAANPNVSQKDVKDFCDREVNKRSTSPQ